MKYLLQCFSSVNNIRFGIPLIFGGISKNPKLNHCRGILPNADLDFKSAFQVYLITVVIITITD